ncbi:MAG: mannose-1-phosphate guanylyltransferase/mannose-6-phosphate isomerase [Candidatus Sericytochromatia bacterium]
MSKWLPVILCGGSGTRLWPLSREAFPKQFVALQGAHSLFQQTLLRLAGVPEQLPPLLLTHETHRFLVAEQLRQIQQPSAAILLEPQAQGTAPALTLAALWAQQHQPDALLLVMPSDHLLASPEAFQALLPRAAKLAESGQIVSFGIVPDRPETGYGYVRAEGERLVEFIEKPPLDQAQAYVASGDYLWNSGMYVMRAQTWLEELECWDPDSLWACRQAFAHGSVDAAFVRPRRADFAKAACRSIDYAVMELTARGAVLALAAGWSDVGSWDALHALAPADDRGNTCVGDVVSVAASGNLLRSSGRLLAVVGVDNLLVVETPDAVLVAPRERAQEVRQLVTALKDQQRPETENHRKVARPWGFYETVDRGERFQVKRITVHPGQALSTQWHHHRSEHWVVVRGTARVTRGEETFLLTENQSTYIPVGTLHRLENPGTLELELIEVQSGAYLGEDDIVRVDDRYDRHLDPV